MTTKDTGTKLSVFYYCPQELKAVTAGYPIAPTQRKFRHYSITKNTIGLH